MRTAKVAILTEAGKDVGFGHVARCLGLYEALRAVKAKTSFLVNDNKEVVERLADINTLTYSISDGYSVAASLAKGKDAVIIDSYRIEKKIYSEVAKSIGLLVSIDDYNRIEYPQGIVVNGSVYAEEIDYPKTMRVEYLLGTTYIPLRKEFCGIKPKKIKDKIKTVLIIFGGYDPNGMVNKIKELVLSKFTGVKLNLIYGAPLSKKEKPKDRNGKNKYYFNLEAKKVSELMKEADIAISAGGQTLYELARTGTPAIGICIADNQLNNLKGWQRYGFLEYCGWYNDPNLFCNLGSALEKLNDSKIREKMGSVGRRLVDGRGAERVVERILREIR